MNRIEQAFKANDETFKQKSEVYICLNENEIPRGPMKYQI